MRNRMTRQLPHWSRICFNRQGQTVLQPWTVNATDSIKHSERVRIPADMS